jgi:hypothetical protein
VRYCEITRYDAMICTKNPKDTVVTVKIMHQNSKKPSMANIDFRGEVSSSDLGMDWTWLLEPLPPMLQENHTFLYST